MENQVFLDFGLRFNLRQTKQNKPTIIYAVFMWKGVQYKINTSVKVYPAHWDSKSQSATVSNRLSKLNNHNNRIVNKRISEIMTSFYNLKCYICENIEVNVIQLIKNSIYSKTTKKMKSVKVEKMTSFLEEMAYSKPGKRVDEYLFVIKRLKKYLEEHGIDDNISLLNGDLLNDYQKTLIKEKKSIRTIRKYIADIQTLIRRSKSNKNIIIDLSTLDILEDKRTTEQKKSKQVPLTEKQLLELYHLKNLTEKEEEARDLFICQSLLGQRISDMPKIFKGDYTTNLHGEGLETISFNVEKTNEEATLYLFPVAKEIINKYVNKQFKYYDLFETDEKKIMNTERVINTDIKNVCKKAGLTTEINYTVQIGEEVKSERKPLYQLMHTHIARHTFITLMCKMGISKEVVIIATAHTDIKMINDVYLHETASDKGKKLIDELRKVSKQSKLFSIPSAQSNERGVLNSLFAYDLLINISNLMKKNIDVFHMDNTRQAIKIIKDISSLSNYQKEIDKEKVISLDKIIFEISFYYRDAQLYSIFQYKEQYFGIIDSVASYDDVNMMFADEDIERPKQQLESEIEEYEKYLKGE